MRKKMNKKTICLTAAACMLIAGITVENAMAYFTTYAIAEGGYKINLGFSETEIEEKVVDSTKEIRIKNTGDYACFVRVKALTGNAYKENLKYSEPDQSGKWTPGADEYYYYSDIVEPEEFTSQLDVKFSFPKDSADAFNVIIIQECTIVRYDADGIPYADWDEVADINETVVVE